MVGPANAQLRVDWDVFEGAPGGGGAAIACNEIGQINISVSIRILNRVMCL